MNSNIYIYIYIRLIKRSQFFKAKPIKIQQNRKKMTETVIATIYNIYSKNSTSGSFNAIFF